MRAKTKLKKEELEQIAKDLGVRMEWSSDKTFVLKPEHKSDTYRRKGLHINRVNAVCLHGYTNFMIEILKRDRDAVFYSTFGKVNSKNIKMTYENLSYINMGSMIKPLYYCEACHCNDTVEDKIYENLKEV